MSTCPDCDTEHQGVCPAPLAHEDWQPFFVDPGACGLRLVACQCGQIVYAMGDSRWTLGWLEPHRHVAPAAHAKIYARKAAHA